jgi:hypothetical protein
VIFTVDLGLIAFDDLPEMTGREVTSWCCF